MDCWALHTPPATYRIDKINNLFWLSTTLFMIIIISYTRATLQLVATILVAMAPKILQLATCLVKKSP